MEQQYMASTIKSLSLTESRLFLVGALKLSFLVVLNLSISKDVPAPAHDPYGFSSNLYTALSILSISLKNISKKAKR